MDSRMLANAGAAYSVEDACGAQGEVSFTVNQAIHYGKSEFIQHAGVAESVGRLLSVFYDTDTHGWTIGPEDLKEIVLKNINTVEGTKIYGSAIAFEPNLWRTTEGLEAGVPFPASSDACLDMSTEFCENQNENVTNLRVESLFLNDLNETIYCPYAYQGSPFDVAFTNCSVDTPQFCPTMDLARAYDYSDTNNPDVEWYTAPRCLFFQQGISTGYWTSPYFDAGAGNINMVTYSQPIISADNTFLGIATIDIQVEALCYGNQCENACPAEEYSYQVSECQGPSGDKEITYFSDDPSCPIDPNARDTLTCSYVPASSVVGILLLFMGSLGAVICLLVLVGLILKRDSAIIRASQFYISLGFVASGVLANVGTFTFVGNQTSRCALHFWALTLPVTMQLAFLFGKVYRTFMMFLWARNPTYNSNSNQTKRKTLSDWQLLTKIALVVAIQVMLLIVWTIVEKPTAVTQPMDESVDQRYCVADACFPTETTCQQQHGIVGYFPMLLLAVLVIAGCLLTFQSRNLPNCFCEAKYVMIAMYTVALVMGITILVILVGGEELPLGVYALLLTFATCITATWTVLVIFLPKFHKLWTTPESKLKKQLKNKARSHVSNFEHSQMHSSDYLRTTAPECGIPGRIESGLESIAENQAIAGSNRRPRTVRFSTCDDDVDEDDHQRTKSTVDVLAENKASWGAINLSTVMQDGEEGQPAHDTKDRDVLAGNKASWGGINLSTVLHNDIDDDGDDDNDDDDSSSHLGGDTRHTFIPKDSQPGLERILHKTTDRMDHSNASTRSTTESQSEMMTVQDHNKPSQSSQPPQEQAPKVATEHSSTELSSEPDPADGDWSCYIP